jgi:chromosome segregation ATPase
MFPSIGRGLLLALLAAGLALPALAQDSKRENREREALRRAQQQAQKAIQDLGALQQKFDAAEQERSKLAAEVGGAQSRAQNESARGQRLQRELQAMTGERDALQARNKEQESQLQALNARAAQLERDLAGAKQRGQQLDTQGASLRGLIAACEDRNTKLYATGRSLIEQCRDRSATDSVLRLEPFTGIHRVGIENMLEAQRDRLDEQKTPAASNASP